MGTGKAIFIFILFILHLFYFDLHTQEILKSIWVKYHSYKDPFFL